MYKLDINGIYANKIGTNEWVHTVDNPVYAAWLAEGNTPEPADVPDPKIAIQAQIDSLEAQQLLPRISREFMLLSFATQAAAAGVDPMLNIAYAKLKAFDDQITALRNQLV